MRRLIIRWLGIDLELKHLQYEIDQVRTEARKARVDLGFLLRAAKAFDELSPERKVESDKIGDAIIGRLLADDMARQKLKGEL